VKEQIAMKPFLKIIPFVVIFFLLATGCSREKQPGQSENSGDKMREAGAEKPLIRVGSRKATEEQIIGYIEGDTTKKHKMRSRGVGATVTGAVQEMVRNFLITSDIEDSYMEKSPYADYRAYLEDSIVDKHFREQVLPERLKVSREEVKEKAPKKWEKLKLRQITLPTWDEAVRTKKRIDSGEDFVSLIRKLDIGPGRIQDGLYVDYIPETTPRFNEEDLEHLFGLEVGDYSRILLTKIGFAICRVEDIKEIPEKERQKKLRKIEASLYAGKVEKLMEGARKSVVVKDLDEKEFDRLTQLHLQGKTDSRDSVVFKTVDRELHLRTVMFLADKIPDPMPDLTFIYKVSKYRKRALKMREVIVGAHLARDGGVEVTEQDRPRVDEYVMKNLLEFHYDQIIGEIIVTREEAKKFFQENPTTFFGKGSVEIYDIQTGVRSIAEEVREKAMAGEDFGALAKIYSIERKSAEKGGYLGTVEERGLDPEVADAAFTLKEGNISEVVLSKSGYHVLKVKRKIPPQTYAFEDREEQIIERYRDIKRERAREEYIAKLRDKYDVDVRWDEIKKVIERLEERTQREN
jgi:parvulin-like peptidyl-prolyl isomerase